MGLPLYILSQVAAFQGEGRTHSYNSVNTFLQCLACVFLSAPLWRGGVLCCNEKQIKRENVNFPHEFDSACITTVCTFCRLVKSMRRTRFVTLNISQIKLIVIYWFTCRGGGGGGCVVDRNSSGTEIPLWVSRNLYPSLAIQFFCMAKNVPAKNVLAKKCSAGPSPCLALLVAGWNGEASGCPTASTTMDKKREKCRLFNVTLLFLNVDNVNVTLFEKLSTIQFQFKNLNVIYSKSLCLKISKSLCFQKMSPIQCHFFLIMSSIQCHYILKECRLFIVTLCSF